MSPQASLLRHVSQGIVAENKPMSSNKILVTPIESLMMLDGELKSNPTKMETEGQDAAGKVYKTSVLTDTAVEAEWYPGDAGFRKSSPDVRRGERVELYQYGDTDKFYWKALGADSDKRKLETIVWGLSGTQDEAKDSTQRENMYWIEMSTHTGAITLHTSKQNGEHCIYAIQINTKDGRILITDDLGNEIDFDSAATNISIKNAKGTMFELNQQDINAKCDGSITAKAGKDILLKAGGKITLDAPKTIITQELEVGGKSTFKGDTTTQGKSTFQQKMTATGIQSSAPIQGPSQTI